MGVPSFTFFVFAAIAAALFNLFREIAWRRAVLLLANLIFLASFVSRPAELLPYAGFLLLGFFLIGRGTSAAASAAAIGLVLLCFFWLKQYTFLPAATFITAPYLLVGLSYVFFRVMHLVIDARDPDQVGRLNIVDYLNFTLNFTCLVSGPIQRYEDYRATEREAPLPLGLAEIGGALERIVTGLFKILVVATLLSVVQKSVARQLVNGATFSPRVGAAAMLVALYPVYLYFNFSGYTDLVIGIARFFRIRLPENFDRPFTSASFIDYWSRWHMSLSNWLKTYVYNPSLTAMMRRIKSPRVLPYAGAAALFLTFFLVGAWHGRTSKFLFFGLLNGAGVAANQAYRIILTKRLGRKPYNAMAVRPFYIMIGRGLTFSWVGFTLLWFWSDWPELGRYAGLLGPSGIAALWIVLPIASAIVLALLIRLRAVALRPQIGGEPLLASHYVRTARLSAMLFLILMVQGVMNAAAPEIVYKDF